MEEMNRTDVPYEEAQGNGKFQNASIAPMHTAEHILNQTMVRMFGCRRSNNAHIERKKSKVNYELSAEPTKAEIAAIEEAVNRVIENQLPVYDSMVAPDEIPEEVSLERLPEESRQQDSIRLVFVGDYDVCACSGLHVKNTGELGRFRITSTSYLNGVFRIVYKLDLNAV